MPTYYITASLPAFLTAPGSYSPASNLLQVKDYAPPFTPPP